MVEPFEGTILGSKVLIMGLLFILSLVNAYTKFISSQPRKFLVEASLVGLASAISFAFIGALRGVYPVQLINVAVLAFLVFFVFHLFMEMAGFNQGAIDPSKLGGNMQKQQKALTSTPVKAIVITVLGILLVMALFKRDFTLRGDEFERLSPVQLSLEALTFGVLNALPTIMISLDRGAKSGKKIAKDTSMMAGAFFAGHILLQMGGFYSSAFGH